MRVGPPFGDAQSGNGDMTTKSIDVEVVQRLAKGLDFAVLTCGALVLTMLLAVPGKPEAVGFFALIVAFASLLGVRGGGFGAPPGPDSPGMVD